MRSVILFVALIGCSKLPVKSMAIDPCVVVPSIFLTTNEEKKSEVRLSCRAVPLNQEGKEPYDRPIKGGDIVLTPEDYAALQKKIGEFKERCQ